MNVSLMVNGEARVVDVAPNTLLVELLRQNALDGQVSRIAEGQRRGANGSLDRRVIRL